MARAAEEVASELQRLGCDATEVELNELAKALSADETILEAVSAGENYAGYAEHALWIQTNKQVLKCHRVRKRFLSPEKAHLQRLFWENIANLQYRTGAPDFVELRGYGGSGSVRFHLLPPAWSRAVPGIFPKERLEKFIDSIQERLVSGRSGVTTSGSASHPPSSSTRMSFLEQLESVANLRERGHLTKEEFEIAKKRLLEGK